MRHRFLLPCMLPLLMIALRLAAEDKISRQGIEVLTRHCTGCHGETRMSALDLRQRESALKGGTRALR
jgi:hypothetical protein